ncbi:MAG: ABC transporter permease, partial [Acidimicrobiales bacterium]
MARLAAIAIRALKLAAVVLIVSFLTFSLTKLLPGDPVNVILGPEASNEAARAAVIADLDLDKGFFQQYFSYIGGV